MDWTSCSGLERPAWRSGADLLLRGRYDEAVTKKRDQADIGDLKLARSLRTDADRNASMSERLARVHTISKQMSAIKGAAAGR